MSRLIKLYDPAIVFATLGIAFFGSYCYIVLYEQYRLCSKENKPKLLSPTTLLILMAFSIGGVAIWSMHFVAMSRMIFLAPDTRERITIRYRLDYTIISLLAVVLLSFIGLKISSLDRRFVADKKDVVTEYIDNVKRGSIAEIRNIDTKCTLLTKSLFRNMLPIYLGGIITAGGVCVMHYIGMKAMYFDGRIEWDSGIIACSVIIALIASTAALWILFRLLSLFPEIEMLRFASASIASIAVNGMHYTGMAAGRFVYEPNSPMSNTITISQQSSVYVACAIVAFFLSSMFLIIIADLRIWFHRLNVLVHELDQLANKYESTMVNGEMFLSDYIQLRKLDNEIQITSLINSKFAKKSSPSQYTTRVRVSKFIRPSPGSGKPTLNLSTPSQVIVKTANNSNRNDPIDRLQGCFAIDEKESSDYDEAKIVDYDNDASPV